jgi:hypothetical protein
MELSDRMTAEDEKIIRIISSSKASFDALKTYSDPAVLYRMRRSRWNKFLLDSPSSFPAGLSVQDLSAVFVHANVQRHGDLKSVLHVAVEHANETMVTVLLAHGANPFLQDASGLCPMDYCLSLVDDDDDAIRASAFGLPLTEVRRALAHVLGTVTCPPPSVYLLDRPSPSCLMTQTDLLLSAEHEMFRLGQFLPHSSLAASVIRMLIRMEQSIRAIFDTFTHVCLLMNDENPDLDHVRNLLRLQAEARTKRSSKQSKFRVSTSGAHFSSWRKKFFKGQGKSSSLFVSHEEPAQNSSAGAGELAVDSASSSDGHSGHLQS